MIPVSPGSFMMGASPKEMKQLKYVAQDVGRDVIQDNGKELATLRQRIGPDPGQLVAANRATVQFLPVVVRSGSPGRAFFYIQWNKPPARGFLAHS